MCSRGWPATTGWMEEKAQTICMVGWVTTAMVSTTPVMWLTKTGGDGTDTVYSSVSFNLADPLHAIGAIENLTLTGSSIINATGNDLDNTLLGNSKANVIIGGAGADWLDGGGGTDTANYATSASGVS